MPDLHPCRSKQLYAKIALRHILILATPCVKSLLRQITKKPTTGYGLGERYSSWGMSWRKSLISVEVPTLNLCVTSETASHMGTNSIY